MCNVCIADQALAVTTCGKTTCVAFQEGYRIHWFDAPVKVRKSRATGRRVLQIKEPVIAYVRARGKGSECKPAEYQIRREYERWPTKWTKTNDLAHPMGMYGFDVKWKYVPEPMKQYLLGGKDVRLPTEAQIHEFFATRPPRRGKRSIKRHRTRSS